MKRLLSIVVLLLVCFVVPAQDKIVKKDGEIILAKIRSITDQDLHYYIISTDENGNTFPDESTIYVISLDKLERVILSSGRELFHGENDRKEMIQPVLTNPNIFPRYKNPALAYLFSTIPGVGQFYNDEVNKGLYFISALLIEGLVFTISYNSLTKTETYTYYDDYYPYTRHTEEREVTNRSAVVGAFLSGVAFSVTYLWASIDAVITANKLNIANGYVVKARPTLGYNALSPMGKGDFTAGLSISLIF